MSTFVDGIGASENIDSSGECILISGMDISTLAVSGVLTWEHVSNIPSAVVGKIIKAKKIFTNKDCEDDRQLYFWNKCNSPFIYCVAELFDDYNDSAKEVAGMFRYDHDRDGKQDVPVIGFSIEGAYLERDGSIVKRSIARKLTCTTSNCNKMAIAKMVPSKTKQKDNIDELFKTEFTPNVEILEKALDAGSGMAAPSQLVGGAALAPESLSKPMVKPLMKPKKVLIKSKTLQRAEEEYNKWPKKKEFEAFMAKRMPHLTKAEVRVLGQVMSLNKSNTLEKSLSDLIPLKKWEDKLKGGEADKKKPSDFDHEELAMGIKHEMEHTNDIHVATEIAMDHLLENPKYYTELNAAKLE